MSLRKLNKYNRNEANLCAFRLSVLVAVVVSFSFVLVLRLAYLQLAQYQRYATLSLKNQMSIIPLAPPRGIIYDRNGVILADNIPVYALEITPERVKNISETLNNLKALLPSISVDDVENYYRAVKQNRAYVPIAFKLHLNAEEVAIFASNQYKFPGVSIKARLMRYYPMGEAAAHLVGYVSRLNEEELKSVNTVNYRATNFIGKIGIEKYYETLLHGQVGYQQVETDVSGRTLRTINKQNPTSGAKIYLTIDAKLQQAAYLALKDKRGAVVAINPENGEILAMASSPTFDPNLFVNGISSKDYRTLSQAADRPLYNRAVRGLYPPASTLKPFVAIAGLEKGTITPDTKVYDPGWYRLPGVSHYYRDWKRTGHGVMNLKRAITVSCDTYFYQLGNKMGILAMEEILMQFGFGQLTQVDLLEEVPGLLPSPRWKRRAKNLPWYPGDTLITSIGQGFMLVSPLQLASAVAALSQHGKRFQPHLLGKSIFDHHRVRIYKPKEAYPIRLKYDEYWNYVIEGMQNVIVSNEGTGYRFGRDAPYTVAAKTGTAQVFGGEQYEKRRLTIVPEALRDNSLFIAFAPVEHPKIALAVMVEHDTTASAVARQVTNTFFESIQPEAIS